MTDGLQNRRSTPTKTSTEPPSAKAMVAGKTTKRAPSPRSRHGLSALKGKVAIRGLKLLDKRSPGARELLRWRQEAADALGGEASLSPQRRALLDAAARQKLLIEAMDEHLLTGHVVNRRSHRVYQLVVERQRAADSLLRFLTALGLDKIEVQPSLAEYLAEREANNQTQSALDDADPYEPDADEINQASDAQDDRNSPDVDADQNADAGEDEPQ